MVLVVLLEIGIGVFEIESTMGLLQVLLVIFLYFGYFFMRSN